MADLSALRQSYQDVLAGQLKKGLGQIGNIYAGRGTTGSGEEARAFGELGQQYGQGVATNELALQQFGEGQRQFDVGQGNWGQQFGLQEKLGLGGLNLQQQQLAQQGSQFGQGLAEQIAARQGSQGLQQQQLAQQGSQFGQGLAEQIAARQGSQGLQQQQLAQQGSQFGQGLAEQQAGRLFGQKIAESGLTGQYNNQDTQQYLQQQFQNQLAQAGITGQYGKQETLQSLQQKFANQLAAGELTGNYGGQKTLAGQQLEAQQTDAQRLDDIAKAAGLNSGTDLTIMAQYDKARYDRIMANYYNNLFQSTKGFSGMSTPTTSSSRLIGF